MQTNTQQHIPNQAPSLAQLFNQAHGLAQLLTLDEVCDALRKSRSGFYKLMAADPSFPAPIKDGQARSARVFL